MDLKDFIFDLQCFAAIIQAGGSDQLIEGTNGVDQISSSGDRVTIVSGDAKDHIDNSGQECSIDAGAGTDRGAHGAAYHL